MFSRSVCLLLALGCVGILGDKSYKGYKVFDVRLVTEQDAEFVHKLTVDDNNYDVWRLTRIPGDSATVMVEPGTVDHFTALMEDAGLEVSVTMEDVGTVLARQTAEREARQTAAGDQTRFDDFRDLAGIYELLDQFEANYPALVTGFVVGTSYEGRPIRGVKISTGGVDKPALFMDSCITPREWISASTTTWMTNQLLEDYTNGDPEIVGYLDNIDVYVVPVFNVDGYEFTWTTDRLWRKTRSPNAGSACIGTDPNRNWEFAWCESGASTDPCADTYCGSAPFSEVEVQAVVDYLGTIPNLQTYIAYHSFGPVYMRPYSYSTDAPADDAVVGPLCDNAAAAVAAVNGVEFFCDRIALVFGPTGGSSVDYTKEVLGVPYNFGPELRGTDFILDPSNIIPSGLENYEGLKVLLAAL